MPELVLRHHRHVRPVGAWAEPYQGQLAATGRRHRLRVRYEWNVAAAGRVHAAAAVVLDPPVSRDNGLVFWSGGPVEPERGFLLLGESPGAVDSQCVSEGLYLTASVEVLRRLLECDPEEVARKRCRLLLGYAGWGPGQLDRELTASAWLTAPAEAGLVFGTAPEAMWERAIRSLGVDPLALQLGPGIQ